MNLVTPITKQPLLQKDYDTLLCQESGVEYHRVNGIWQLIAPERRSRFKQFVREYEEIRLAEGRFESDKSFYQQLPLTPAEHPAADMWAQRAQSFQVFVESILMNIENSHTDKLNILDLGAGNGWLSNQMITRNHEAVAIDLTINDFDGLGVCAAYHRPITAIQAEFNYLPLESNQFDIAIFNASFHYSTDYTETLAEALRVTKNTGAVIVIDTPMYKRAEAGDQMVAEREIGFEKRFGFKSNSLDSENYLTANKVARLKRKANCECKSIPTVSMFRKTARRLKTKVRGQRESAEFPILIFQEAGGRL